MSLYSKVATWAIMSLIVISTSYAGESEVKVQQQVMCLAQNIYYEAGLESHDGMVAVAQVTLNRAEDEKFPKTVCGVVHQKTRVSKDKVVCQFSWVCNPPAPIKYVSDRWQDSLDVAREVMFRDARLTELEEALYFHNTQSHPAWGLQRVARIGNHIFYSDQRKKSNS